MKKSALALAVAAALVGFGSAAYADTTLYGSARVSIDYNDVSNANYVLLTMARQSDATSLTGMSLTTLPAWACGVKKIWAAV